MLRKINFTHIILTFLSELKSILFCFSCFIIKKRKEKEEEERCECRKEKKRRMRLEE